VASVLGGELAGRRVEYQDENSFDVVGNEDWVAVGQEEEGWMVHELVGGGSRRYVSGFGAN
jgi:hypothetical protein